MKLGIYTNFAYPHIGGSEIVVKNISERLSKDFNYEVNVYSFNCKSNFVNNGVNYYPCSKNFNSNLSIAQNDHIFVYSDSCWAYPSLLKNIDKIDCRVSVALVGAYYMREQSSIVIQTIKDNSKKIYLISHSKANIDYKWCNDNDLPVNIIPNGVNLSEFDANIVNFREKYGIKEKYIFLNVSSFFYGKGQEFLPLIYNKLKNIFDNFIILSISNTVNYPYDKVFLDRVKRQSKGMNIRFLRDLPRHDVVGAFKASDLFLFTSRKEVSPLVILEACAAGTPWVSMDVGDVEERNGGIIVPCSLEDKKGYKIADNAVLSEITQSIEQIVNDRDIFSEQGRKSVENLEWGKIIPEYDRIFSLSMENNLRDIE
jgi:glycosyltransferase involved in cell wall biosynthesis